MDLQQYKEELKEELDKLHKRKKSTKTDIEDIKGQLKTIHETAIDMATIIRSGKLFLVGFKLKQLLILIRNLRRSLPCLLALVLIGCGSAPPLQSPHVTQQFTTDWVIDIHKKHDNDVYKEIWKDLKSRQPIATSSNSPTMRNIFDAQMGCNDVYIVTESSQLDGKDINLWGEKDYWATPLEFKAKEMGDCEDYAICKYYELRSKGFGASDLNIWIGIELMTGTPHAILAVEFKDKEYILDNEYDQIFLAKDYMNRYFRPMYRTNENGMTFF